MIDPGTIKTLIQDYIAKNNLELVDVKNNNSNNIKVYFNNLNRDTNIDDCVALSKHIESVLDREKEDFSLTVSSAGKN